MSGVPVNKNQLSDFEFEILATAGSDMIEKMINQRVRVVDKVSGSGHVESALDYVAINSRDSYYVRKGYHCATIYFLDPIDCENFTTMMHSYAENCIV